MNNDELMHYGVRGMKWGVRRASKAALNAKTSKQYNSAIKTLDSHRAKSVKKLKKLERNAPKLEKRARRAIEETDVRAAQLKSDAARYYEWIQRKYRTHFGSNPSK